MRDETFARLVRRMRGAESPRPEFVEALYADLAARLGDGADPESLPAGDGSTAIALEPAGETARPSRSGWWIAAAAAVLGLLVLGVPALLLRSSGGGLDPAATTTVPAPSEVELVAGRPVGIAVYGEVEASYLLYLPVGYDPAEPVPVVVSLGNESGGQSGGLGCWGPGRADDFGVAVVSMAPSGHAWAYAATEEEASRVDDDWIGSPAPVGGGDVAALEAVLDDVEQRLTVADVFVVGQYRGGLMAGRLACALPDRLVAVAGYPHAVYVPADCDPQAAPVPRMSIGPAEEEVTEPFATATAEAAFAEWSVRAGCTGPAESSSAEGNRETRYSGCDGGAHHLLVVVDASGSDLRDDPVPLIWQFFTEAAGS
jgi:poly(3-hydroxybutyrate) depolymerase